MLGAMRRADLARRVRPARQLQQLPQRRPAGRHGPHARPHLAGGAGRFIFGTGLGLVRAGLRRVRLRVRYRRVAAAPRSRSGLPRIRRPAGTRLNPAPTRDIPILIGGGRRAEDATASSPSTPTSGTAFSDPDTPRAQARRCSRHWSRRGGPRHRRDRALDRHDRARDGGLSIGCRSRGTSPSSGVTLFEVAINAGDDLRHRCATCSPGATRSDRRFPRPRCPGIRCRASSGGPVAWGGDLRTLDAARRRRLRVSSPGRAPSVVIRGVGVHLDGGPLALARLVVGALALGASSRSSPATGCSPAGREWLLLARSTAVAWFGAYNVAWPSTLAEQTLDAGTTAMIVNMCGPLLIALGAGSSPRRGRAPVARDRLRPSRSRGWCSSGSRPSACVQRRRAQVDLRRARSWPLSSAITYATRWSSEAHRAWRLPAGAGHLPRMRHRDGRVPAVRGAAFRRARRRRHPLPASAWVGTVYLGIVPTALAFTTWAYALAAGSGGPLGVSTYLVPRRSRSCSAWLVVRRGPPSLGGALSASQASRSRGVAIVKAQVAATPSRASSLSRLVGVVASPESCQNSPLKVRGVRPSIRRRRSPFRALLPGVCPHAHGSVRNPTTHLSGELCGCQDPPQAARQDPRPRTIRSPTRTVFAPA